MQGFKKKLHRGFTLVEMLIVLLIISVLILLFVPNLAKHKDVADKQANAAIVKVVETQMELFRIEFPNEEPTTTNLLGKNFITREQKERYDELKSDSQN